MRLLRVQSEEPGKPREGWRNVYDFGSTWIVLFNGEISIRYGVVSFAAGLPWTLIVLGMRFEALRVVLGFYCKVCAWNNRTGCEIGVSLS
jgi:hypothetical protein